MTGRGFLVSGVLLGFTCLTIDARAQSCQKDNDCAGDLVCNGGQCQTLSGATPPAATTPAAGPVDASAPAAAPAAGAVNVQFVGEPFVLTDKTSGQTCQVPCSMQLTPGQHTLDTDGKGTWDILVDAQGGTYRVSQGDIGMILGGAMATAFGSVGVIVGGVFTIVGSSSSDDTSSYSSTESSGSDLGKVGLPLLIGGVILLPIGITLLASADGGGVTKTAKSEWSESMPMVGVAPTRGGAMFGAAVQF